MFNLNEWDEYIGDDILNGCKTKEEFVSEAIACYDSKEDEEERKEEKESAESEWEETIKEYQKYTSTYYEKIASKLDGEDDNYSVCPHCGQSDHFENDDYMTGEYEVECSRCCSEYEVYIEDAGYGDFTIKTIRPKCERNEHQFIFIEESSEKWNFHRINFPYKKTNKYHCLKCGKEEYRPLNSDGEEYSKRYFKKLQRKFEKGFQPIKIDGNVKINSSSWSKRTDIEVKFGNEKQIEKCEEKIKKDFRNSIKDIVEKEEVIVEKTENFNVRFNRVFKITLKTGFCFNMKWEYNGFELSYENKDGYLNSKEPLRMLNRIKKYLKSLGLEIEDNCFVEKNHREISKDVKDTIENPWEGYPLNGKLVGYRNHKGILSNIGIAYCFGEGDCQNNVYIIDGDNFIRSFKRNVVEIIPGVKYRDTSKIREERLLEELKKASLNWDFEKGIILRNILTKEGYEKNKN